MRLGNLGKYTWKEGRMHLKLLSYSRKEIWPGIPRAMRLSSEDASASGSRHLPFVTLIRAAQLERHGMTPRIQSFLSYVRFKIYVSR